MPDLKVPAKVKYACSRDPKQTQYGPRVNAVFESPNFQGEIKIWASPPHGIQSLRKGQEVILVQPDGKKHWEVESLPPPPAEYSNGSSQEKPPLLEAGTRYLDLYAHFRSEAIARMPDAPLECIQAATASTLIFLHREYGMGLVGQAEAIAPEPRTAVPKNQVNVPVSVTAPSLSQPLSHSAKVNIAPANRLKAICRRLGLPPRQGVGMIKAAISDECGEKESWQLSSNEVDQVRDQILVNYGLTQLPDGYETIVRSQYYEMLASLASNKDEDIIPAWLELVVGLVAMAKPASA